MDYNRLEEANTLFNKIDELKNNLTICKIMCDNKHDHLAIVSSMKFRLPVSQAETVLLIAKSALEKELKEAQEAFDRL